MYEDLAATIAALPEHERRIIENRISGHIGKPRKITDQQRAWVAEYCVDFNGARAAHAVGFAERTSKHFLCDPKKHQVRALVAEKVAEREEATDLRADYVRQYMHDVLELCPGDYFTADESGEWHISRDRYEALPHRVKRLICSIECTVDGFRVHFVSKQHALTLAAKYTLTQNIATDTTLRFPWEVLANAATSEPELDLIEAKIQEALNGSNAPSGEAGGDLGTNL